MSQQSELIPQPTAQTITVPGDKLAETAKRVRDLGGVVLGWDVKGGSYTLEVVMPPGELIEQTMEGDRLRLPGENAQKPKPC